MCKEKIHTAFSNMETILRLFLSLMVATASLSSIRLDGLVFKFSRLIKHDYLLHALLLFILHVQYCLFISDCTFSV